MAQQKYDLRASPFFRLRTKVKLAELLRVSPKRLQEIAGLENGYTKFQKKKKNGDARDISAPIPPLKKVQARIADLLGRLAAPDYLFAPVAGRSYVDNAARHLGATSVRLLDIEDFFPSCTAAKVIWFFRSRMECSLDVAVIIANIATDGSALPQGSPCSPILAYLAYIDMWNEIESAALDAGCTLSVYADDLTISGSKVPEAMVWDIKKTLYRHGHRYAKHKERSRHNRSAEITGVILTRDGVRPPNRQRLKLQQVREQLDIVKSGPAKSKLEAQLRGRMTQLKQIDAGNR